MLSQPVLLSVIVSLGYGCLLCFTCVRRRGRRRIHPGETVVSPTSAFMGDDGMDLVPRATSCRRTLVQIIGAGVVNMMTFYSQASMEHFNCVKLSDGRWALRRHLEEECFLGRW